MVKRAKRANRANPRTDRNNQDNVIQLPTVRRKSKVEIIPRSYNQDIFLGQLEDPNAHIVFGTGPAGSGKTLIATLMAIKKFKAGEIDKIVITRPNVAVDDRDIGHLPGSLMDKMAPWTRPIMDIFEEYYTKKDIIGMIEEGVLEICPIAFIRGRTFKRSWVLVDEAQGTTANSMKSILTRIGNDSKMVITGDINQSDIGANNGLADFLRKCDDSYSRIAITKFDKSDVVRHPVVVDVLNIYGDED